MLNQKFHWTKIKFVPTDSLCSKMLNTDNAYFVHEQRHGYIYVEETGKKGIFFERKLKIK